MPQESAVGEAEPCFRFMRDPTGEGFIISGTGLWFAGDATVNVGVPEGRPAFVELDDLTLLARYEPTPRLTFFTEVRLEDTLEIEEGKGLETLSGNISIERLYADLLLTPQLTLRVGKSLTPFGLWNPIRRAPLTWTVERPAVTEQTFPEHTTGISLIYRTTISGWSLDGNVYGPAQNQLDFQSEGESGLMAGARFAAGHSLGPAYAAIGLNAAGFQDETSERWADVYGADLDLSLYGNDLTGEFEYTHLRGDEGSQESGFYLQDVIPLVRNLYGVLRFERFHPREGNVVNGELVGLFWRPLPFLILKADYQFADRRSDDVQRGFLASIALFF